MRAVGAAAGAGRRTVRAAVGWYLLILGAAVKEKLD